MPNVIQRPFVQLQAHYKLWQCPSRDILLNMTTTDILTIGIILHGKEVEEGKHKYLCKYILDKIQ